MLRIVAARGLLSGGYGTCNGEGSAERRNRVHTFG
jgi:hypothetical protein